MKWMVLFLLAPILAAGACSTMDNAGTFAVESTLSGDMDPLAAGQYLLVTAFAVERAKTRAINTAEEVITTAGGIGLGGTMGVAGGFSALALGALRILRGSSFRSGSGNSKPPTPTTGA